MKLVGVLLLIFIGIVNADICPENYDIYLSGKCYRIFPASIKVTEARFQCLNDGASLPSIHSAADNQAVTTLASNSKVQVWLGLTCSSSACNWDDGSSYDYQNFFGGGPDVTYGNCVYLSLGVGEKGSWESTNCNFDLKATICQKDPINLSTCNDPFSMGDDGRCYYIPPLIVNTHDHAESYCNNYGANLVSIENDLQNTILSQLANSKGLQEVAIGLYYDGSTYHWTDSRSIYNYTNWSPGFPNTKSGWCTLMSIGGLFNGQWKNIDCEIGLSFACSYDSGNPPVIQSTTTLPATMYPPNVCPPTNYSISGTIQSPGFPVGYANNLNCYYYLEVSPGGFVNLTFYTYTLATYDSISIYDGPNDNSPLIYILTGSFDPNSQIFLSTGSHMTVRFLTDASDTAQGFMAFFQRVDSPVTITSPKTTTTTTLKTSTTMRPTTSLKPTTPTARQCEPGWWHDPFEMYCYKYHSDAGTWDQSLRTCDGEGAQLLTIHDAQQERGVVDFVQNSQGSTKSHVWIGLYKSFGNWAWSDATAVGYLDFLPGEPAPGKDCAAIQSYSDPSGWVALDCSTSLPFVCYHNALSNRS